MTARDNVNQIVTLIHNAQMVRMQWTTEIKDRIHVLGWEKLSMYDQDDLLQSVFVVRETLVELESRIVFSVEY